MGAKSVAAAATMAPTIEPGFFADKAIVPNETAVSAAIGSAHARWIALRTAVAEALSPVTESWAYSGKRYGWSLRLSQRDRPIVYLTPLRDRFRASLALPERAMDAALAADLPPAARSAVAAAPTYPEGRAVRILVTDDEVVASVLTLATIRMAS